MFRIYPYLFFGGRIEIFFELLSLLLVFLFFFSEMEKNLKQRRVVFLDIDGVLVSSRALTLDFDGLFGFASGFVLVVLFV